MPALAIQPGVRLALALGVLALGACARERETFIPASSFAESFAPFEVVSSVAEREGLAAAIRRRGSTCTRGSGGPATTSITCRGQVEVRSREDGARLTRAVFAELERMAESHVPQWDARKTGSPEEGELHLGYCSNDAERAAAAPPFRGCLFLHFLAVENPQGAHGRAITYYFTLDEERSTPPAVKPAAAR